MQGLRRRAALVVWGCIFAAALSAAAEVTVPSIFGDHMVVQRDMKTPVWGKGTPGETVTVTLGEQEGSAVVDQDGRWQVTLEKPAPSGTLEMAIKGKDNTIAFTNILAGEVWVGSGQSNMQMTVNSSNEAEEEIAAASYPEIRLFYVKRTVAGEPQEDCEGEWTVCSPDTIPGFSAVAYFFGRELHKELGVPVGLIHTSWGGTPAESWTSRGALESNPDCVPIVERWDTILADYPKAKEVYDEAMVEWKKAADKAIAEGNSTPGKPNAPMGPDHPHRASGLYNAMIAPIVPYAFRGAIWYQGESNASRAYQYRELFPLMIKDWRRAWNQEPFPFLFVQLANFKAVDPEPVESDWAELREAQLMTLDLENTGMAVIGIDIGEADDIHPRNKQDVGKRLALDALANTYGKDVPYSGPMYKSMAVKGNTIELTFTHTDGGLVAKAGEPLKGFAIAGADKQFVWADAAIDGAKVVVSSDKVAAPAAVRYAWANNPVCNLFNGADLPASPFRTDDWPGMTVSNR